MYGVDCDNFNKVNDLYGHHSGDELLQIVGQTIHTNIRETDYVARIGGDEFAVILYNIAQEEIEKICERIGSNMCKHNERHPDFLLSLSLGHAISTDRKKDIHQLIKEADDNMYCQKLRHNRHSRGALVWLNENAKNKLTKNRKPQP